LTATEELVVLGYKSTTILPGVHSSEIQAIAVWTSTKRQQRVVISNFLSKVETD